MCFIATQYTLLGLCCTGSDIYMVHCRAELYRHTCFTLTSVRQHPARLISIIREDVRGEVGLISLSKAPCQVGNLCTGLRCTNRCTRCDWAFLIPCSQQVFHCALTAETCHLRIEWDDSSGLNAAFLKQRTAGVSQTDKWFLSDIFLICFLPLHMLRQITRQSSLALSFLREEDHIMFAMKLVFLSPCTPFLGIEEKKRKNTVLTIVSILHCTFPISKYSPDGVYL